MCVRVVAGVLLTRLSNSSGCGVCGRKEGENKVVGGVGWSGSGSASAARAQGEWDDAWAMGERGKLLLLLLLLAA